VAIDNIHGQWESGAVYGAGEERRRHVIFAIERFRSTLVKERQEGGINSKARPTFQC
jgi:hypothetical protein